MNSVGEVSTVTAHSEDLRRSQAQPVSVRDENSLANKKPSTANSNLQTRATVGVDSILPSALLPADYYCLSRNAGTLSNQDAVVVGAAVKVKQRNSVAGIRIEDAAEGAAFSSPTRSAMEVLSFTDAESSPSAPARLFPGLENENPCSARSRKDHTLESLPSPRAPVKPSRVRSLNTLRPGKTRRRLDFDHL